MEKQEMKKFIIQTVSFIAGGFFIIIIFTPRYMEDEKKLNDMSAVLSETSKYRKISQDERTKIIEKLDSIIIFERIKK
jgi:hypothetical protein